MSAPAAVLLLTDARFPAGGHAHSGGLEPAVAAGTITDISTLEAFLRGRLRTAGVTAAGLAAATCARVAAITKPRATSPPSESYPMITGSFPRISPKCTHDHGRRSGGAGGTSEVDDSGEAGSSSKADDPGEEGSSSKVDEAGEGRDTEEEAWSVWEALDCEADARIPSPAQREASRRQGRALLRAGRNAWPGARWPPRHAAHHAIVLGAATAAANGTPHEAAQIAAYHSISGPASAAVRLLALDPMRVAAVLASLMTAVDETAALAAGYADGPLAAVGCPSAPALDLLAEAHIRTEARLFES